MKAAISIIDSYIIRSLDGRKDLGLPKRKLPTDYI